MKGSDLALHFIWMAFFGKNPICNTVEHSKSTIFDCLSCSSRAWWLFFSLKTFKTFLKNILCGVLVFLLEKPFNIKFLTVYFCLNCLLLSLLHVSNFCRSCKALVFDKLAPYSKTELTIELSILSEIARRSKQAEVFVKN